MVLLGCISHLCILQNICKDDNPTDMKTLLELLLRSTVPCSNILNSLDLEHPRALEDIGSLGASPVRVCLAGRE